MSDDVLQADNREVTVLLTPSRHAPIVSAMTAANHQQGIHHQALSEQPPKPAFQPASRELSTNGSIDERLLSTTDSTGGFPAAARAAIDAEYIRQWQVSIERFGNRFYPDVAQLYGDGDVRLRVVIAADGALNSAEILASSGIEALDTAAMTTVERSAPFSPFPEELAQKTPELEIIRTWQFRR
ncbi:MAG: TonB family protein [Halieaceae bacterium]